MSIAEQLTKLSTDITNAYNSIQTKGGTIPTNKNTENLASAIDSITAGSSGGDTGGDSFDYGTEVLVQATDNFSVGDTFVGTAVSGVNPQMSSEASGLTSIGIISADGTVAIKSTSISSSSTAITVHIKNEYDTYTAVQVDLPDMTGATYVSIAYQNNGVASINEDGTRIIVNCTAFLLSIKVNKTSFSATADRIEISSVSFGDYRYTIGTTDYELTPTSFASNVFVRGSYIFCTVKATYTSGTVYVLLYGRAIGSTMEHEYVISVAGAATDANVRYCSGVNDFGENDLLFFRGALYFYRIEIFSGEIVSIKEISQSVRWITQNGRYLTYNKNLYKINQETGSCTLVATFKNNLYGVDETGEYVFYNNKCYKVTDTNMATSLGTAYSSSYAYTFDVYFKVVNDSYIVGNGTKYTLILPTTAEYTIAHTKSVSTAGDIYGVVTEAIATGETKTARKLFNA